jgi:hypothetical protein
MDFSTSDIPATGADRRPGRDLTTRFLSRGTASKAVPAPPTGSTKEGRRARGGCVDL